MQDGQVGNARILSIAKVPDAGGGYHFDVAVDVDVQHPTNDRPASRVIQARVFKVAATYPNAETLVAGPHALGPGAGSKYVGTIPVDDADLATGELIYVRVEGAWVVDATDLEATQPKKAPA